MPPRNTSAASDEETHFRLLRLIESNPELSQRELARELGVSLGKANYCLRALASRGWIKATNFKNSRNKLAYAYLLTPRGFEQKARMTVTFLRQKMNEYERLRLEIEQIRQEAERSQVVGSSD